MHDSEKCGRIECGDYLATYGNNCSYYADGRAKVECEKYFAEAPVKPDSSGSAEFDLLSAKAKAKQYIDANVWDGEDRAGCRGDSASFTPDELQELIDEILEHLST